MIVRRTSVMIADEEQREIDRFFWGSGPCCAGCDWWQHLNTLTVLCTKSAPIAGPDRVTMIGMENVSMQIAGGHPFTAREHRCGEFTDEFDWLSLSITYRRSIGCLF